MPQALTEHLLCVRLWVRPLGYGSEQDTGFHHSHSSSILGCWWGDGWMTSRQIQGIWRFSRAYEMPKSWLLCLRNFWFTKICFTSKRKDNVRTLVQASIFGTWKKKRFTPVSEEEGGKRKIKKGFMKAWHVTINRVFIYFFNLLFSQIYLIGG